MSFSTDIKNEIVRNEYSLEEKIALLSSLIKINGTLNMSNKNIVVDIRTENAKTAKLIFLLIQEIYKIDCRLLVSKKNKLNKNNVYIAQIRTNSLEILTDLEIYKEGNLDCLPSSKILKKENAKRAYFTGCFLASGSINDPSSKNYHLEFSTNSSKHADFLQKLALKFELNAKTIKRRNKYVVYLKKSEEISDFLRIINSQMGVLEFEEERISKDYWNSNNRLNICEISNEVKTLNSAKEQIDAIEKIYKFKKEYMLDEKDKQIAQIRIDNPEINLQEMAEIYSQKFNKQISKSGINHRIRKIRQIANEIKEDNNE